jgi:hypothetical protein
LRAANVGGHVSAEAQRKQAIVLEAVQAHLMTAGHDVAHQRGVRLHLATDDEERGAHARGR